VDKKDTSLLPALRDPLVAGVDLALLLVVVESATSAANQDTLPECARKVVRLTKEEGVTAVDTEAADSVVTGPATRVVV